MTGDTTGEATGPPEEASAQVAVADVTESAWSVYDAIPADWSAYVEQLDRWKQTDLVLDVPVGFAVPAGTDPVTGVISAADRVHVAADRSVRVAAIIRTQTCDLGAAPPGDRVPFIELSPLVPHSVVQDREGKPRAKLAREGKLGHLVPVRSPYDSDEAAWYADLRFTIPASKGILLDRDPIDGFDDEADRLHFAEVLAHRYRRAALHPLLSEALPAALDKFVLDNKGNDALAAVEQVRLLVTAGDRLNPETAQLMVLAAGMPLTDSQQAVWTRFQQAVAAAFKDTGLTLGPMVHTDPRVCSAERYRASTPISCPRLNGRVFG